MWILSVRFFKVRQSDTVTFHAIQLLPALSQSLLCILLCYLQNADSQVSVFSSQLNLAAYTKFSGSSILHIRPLSQTCLLFRLVIQKRGIGKVKFIPQKACNRLLVSWFKMTFKFHLTTITNHFSYPFVKGQRHLLPSFTPSIQLALLLNNNLFC